MSDAIVKTESEIDESTANTDLLAVTQEEEVVCGAQSSYWWRNGNRLCCELPSGHGGEHVNGSRSFGTIFSWPEDHRFLTPEQIAAFAGIR